MSGGGLGGVQKRLCVLGCLPGKHFHMQRGWRRENRDRTSRVMVMLRADFLHSSFQRQPVSA